MFQQLCFDTQEHTILHFLFKTLLSPESSQAPSWSDVAGPHRHLLACPYWPSSKSPPRRSRNGVATTAGAARARHVPSPVTPRPPPVVPRSQQPSPKKTTASGQRHAIGRATPSTSLLEISWGSSLHLAETAGMAAPAVGKRVLDTGWLAARSTNVALTGVQLTTTQPPIGGGIIRGGQKLPETERLSVRLKNLCNSVIGHTVGFCEQLTEFTD